MIVWVKWDGVFSVDFFVEVVALVLSVTVLSLFNITQNTKISPLPKKCYKESTFSLHVKWHQCTCLFHESLVLFVKQIELLIPATQQ